MANYALRCDDPSEAIDQIGGMLKALQETKENVQSLNGALTEHVEAIGEANGRLVNSMIEIGGKAMMDNIDNTMGVVYDSLMVPALDAYIMKYGSKHEKDNRADI